MGWLWVLATLIIGVVVVTMALRGAARDRQREIRRAVWPWARAYYALRDDEDNEGPPGGPRGKV